jgi:hypothetical protein
MKKIATYRQFHLTTWLCIGVVIFGQAVLLVEHAAAQDPTPTSTDVSPDPTAELIVSTPTPTFTATPEPTPTPFTPTATPTNRMVDFRVDDDDIDRGSCVEFSWVVRGDIDRVEFEKEDDGKDPILVATLDQREECPSADATYKLIVRWLDGSKTTREIDIEVDENAAAGTGDDNTSGGSGNSSGESSGSNNGSDIAPTPGGAGSFVNVTPIAVSADTPISSGASLQQVSYASAVMSEITAPDGLLGSVSALPETGMSPPDDPWINIKHASISCQCSASSREYGYGNCREQ